MTVLIPKDFTERQEPYFFTLEIWSNNELIGTKNLGYYHVDIEESTGHYVIKGHDSRFVFTSEEISRIMGDHVILRYDIGYHLKFARFSHSSMA